MQRLSHAHATTPSHPRGPSGPSGPSTPVVEGTAPEPLQDGAWLRQTTFQAQHFGSAHLSHITFEGCDFRGVSFMNGQLDQCRFIDCRFDEAMFVHTRLNGTSFTDCVLDHCSFEDAVFDHTCFERAALPATHFLQASATGSTIAESDLTNTVFFGAQHAGFVLDEASRATLAITRPTVLTPVFPERRGLSTPMLHHQVRSRGANALRIAVQAQTVDPQALAREVDAILVQIDRSSPSPVPQQLLRIARAHPEVCPAIATVLHKVDAMLAGADAVVFPGGEDVPPALYGAQPDPRTDGGGDLRRSLLEYAVVDRLFHLRITPGLFVCRSSQILATFFGAELVQHIGEDHRDRVQGRPVQRVIHREVTGFQGHYGAVLGDTPTLTVAAYQHQGIPIDGPHREVLDVWARSTIEPDGPSSRQTIAQGLEATHWPVGATQFHGEFQNPLGNDPVDQAFAAGLSPENGRVFDTVMGGAWTHFRQTGVLAEMIGTYSP